MRSESEIKMTRDRDREVKFKKKTREFSRIETLAGDCNTVTAIVQKCIQVHRDAYMYILYIQYTRILSHTHTATHTTNTYIDVVHAT